MTTRDTLMFLNATWCLSEAVCNLVAEDWLNKELT